MQENRPTSDQDQDQFKLNLTTADGTRSYLEKYLSLNVESVERLSGGFINFVWRAKLGTPYEGQNSIVVKHAEPFTAADSSLNVPVGRLKFEYDSLKMIGSESSIAGEDALISVPSVYHHDNIKHVLIMQDVGTIPTLQDFMLSASPPPPTDIAALIGCQLATFIAGLHNWGRNNESARAGLSANAYGRTVQDLCRYQKVVPNAIASGILDPLLSTVMAALAETDKTSEETAIMGDFWTANVLVNIEESASGEKALKKMWIIDWEACRYGSPATDVGLFAGDCYLISRVHNEMAADAMRHSFLGTYATLAKVDPMEVVIYMGAYWIMWTYYEDIGEAEQRKRLAKGVEYIHRGWERSQQWLPLSLAQELLA
ncbi:hypothetical protein FIBSPDRAFT_938200 [Athelia psychrophila]|uniref:Aminoglycoside phosphotransferase domain-containing protein n=1 Tax=Athelia psychrophila TaxID=1759441 RepID=A0A165Z0X8_9AGAM|nr:hypothetical protein FIBSPDRAFT_938200 [Fibularhizoctonia sp. CBS 109695]